MDVKSGAELSENGLKQRVNNRLASASAVQVPAQANHIASRQNSNARASSAKYYDIASTILGGSGDVEEVFLNAAKNGNLAKLEQLLDQRETVDLDVDCKDKRTGNTALIWAAKRGHTKVVEVLLRHGADTTLCNYEAQTALETAFSPVRTMLLDWLDKQPGSSEKLLLQAAWQGNLAVVSRILHENPRVNVNCQNSEGLTPLMLVARDTLLFERLSNQLNRFYSPVQVVEQLLTTRADIHVTDNDGRSSLHYASQSRAIMADKLVSALISGGMDVELRDRRLFTPIHLASQLGNTNNVVALADGGSSVNIKGFAGLTPLHMTAYNDHQKTAVTLLSYGADVKITDDRGLTPLDVAKTRRMKNMLKEAWAVRDKKDEGNGAEEEKPSVNQKKNGPSSQQEDNGKKKNASVKKKPEVIFDSYVNNKVAANNNNNGRSKGSTQTQAAAARMKTLANVEKCKQAEKKILEEVEVLKQTHPVLQRLHGCKNKLERNQKISLYLCRETTRMLGTSRNTKILPQIGRSCSPSPTRGGGGGEEARLSWEELRQEMASRGRSVSDIKLGVNRQQIGSPLPVADDGNLWRSSSSLSRTSPIPKTLPPRQPSGKHRRSGSDSLLPKAGDLVASCVTAVTSTRGKKSIKSGQAKNGAPRSQVFITQQASITEEGLKPSSSPEEEDNTPGVRFLDSPLDLARCRSFFKEEFILEESRPKEIHSGSDPTSSYSGSSMSSSSPRDTSRGNTPLSSSSAVQPSTSRSLRLDPGLETLLERPSSGEGLPSPGAATAGRETLNRGAMNGSDTDLRARSRERRISAPDSPAVPIIRTHRPLQQQRTRRRSENSLSSSVESEHGFTLLQNKPSHRPLGRAGSLKLADRWRHHSAAGLSAEDSDLPAESTSVHKSHSLDCISPQVQPESEASCGDSHSNQRQSVQLAKTKKRSEVESNEGSSQALSSSNPSSSRSKPLSGKGQSVSTTIEPFSGKVKMMASAEFEKWDSYLSVGDDAEGPQSSGAKKVLETKPSPTALKPSRSKGSQKQSQGQGKGSIVSKSCSDVAGSRESPEEHSPDSIRPQTVLEGATRPSDEQNCPVRSLTFDQSLDSARSTNVSVRGSFRRRRDPNQQAYEDSPQKPSGTPLTGTSTGPGPDRLFVVSEDSVRKSSASKQRADERAAAAQAAQVKFREAAGVATSQKSNIDQKPQAVDSKLKSASKASFIEKNLMRNQRNVQATAAAAKSKVAVASRSEQVKNGPVGKSGQASSEMKQDSRARVSSFGGKVVAGSTTSNKRPAVTTVMGRTNPAVSTAANTKDTTTKENLAPQTNANSRSKSTLSNATATTKTATATNKSDPTNNRPAPGNAQQNVIRTGDQNMATESVTNSEKSQDSKTNTTATAVESAVKITFSEAEPQPGPAQSEQPSRKPQTPIQTPVIVNPFENFVNKYVKANESVTKDAVVKMKKTTGRGGKKSTAASSSKGRPTSNTTRTNSAGKKRGGKAKTADGDTRPKSGKKVSKRKTKQPLPTTESELTQDAKNPNTALISGIGWQLSTACADTSDVYVTKDPKYYLSDSDPDTYFSDNGNDDDDDDDDVSEFGVLELVPDGSNGHKTSFALESARDNTKLDSARQRNLLEVDQRLREAFKEKVTENSPRFLEMKWRQETQTELRLPLAEDDGFPPMNLDVTQHIHRPLQNSDVGQGHKRNNRKSAQGEARYPQPDTTVNKGKVDGLNIGRMADVQEEIFLGKLTPIPEGPSALTRTTNAISEFDREIKGSQLSLLLDGGSDNDLDTDKHQSKEFQENSRNKSPGKAVSGSGHKKTSASRDNGSEKLKDDGSLNYEYTPSGKSVKNTKSTRGAGTKFSELQNPAKNDKNNNEEEIDDAIEEILNSTTSSLASTLKNFNFEEESNAAANPGFGCHSLTDGDRSLLLKMRNSNYSSPFHAKSRNNESPNINDEDLDSPPTPTEEICESKAALSSTFPRQKQSAASSSSSSVPQKKSTSGAQQSKFDQAGHKPSTGTNKDSTSKVLPNSPSGQTSSRATPSTSRSAGKPPMSVRSSLQDEGQGQSPTRGRLTRSSSTREISKREGITTASNEEEAKQLARVINSFRHMELHATPHSHAALSAATRHPSRATNSSVVSPAARSANGPTRGSSGNLPGTTALSMVEDSLGLPPRPSSCAGAKRPGRFHELKGEEEGGSKDGVKPVIALPAVVTEALSQGAVSGSKNRSGSSGAPGKDSEPGTSSKAQTARSDEDGITAEEERLLEQISKSDFVPSGIPLEYLDSRRGSLAGSECTVDSIKSAQEETIQWKKGNILGKGAFGTVWCGLTSEGQLIAVKQIELTTLNHSKAQREYEKVQEEVELLKTLEHVNIVGYLGTSLEDNIVSIFMQFIPGGSIASILARFGALDEAVFRRYTRQILEGVRYLHSNDVIHRDIKGANVMLMPNGVIKLIDFGCAKRLCINLSLSQAEILKSMKGTPYWMAPEVVNETGHGKKSDIWSVGCSVFEMATRKPPWADMNPMAAIFAIGSSSRPVPSLDEKFTVEARDFVSLCLTRDQDKRPSAGELLDHIFLTRKSARRRQISE